MQRFTRLALGGIFGSVVVAAALALSPAPASATYLECTDTANYTCCEDSFGKVECAARVRA